MSLAMIWEAIVDVRRGEPYLLEELHSKRVVDHDRSYACLGGPEGPLHDRIRGGRVRGRKRMLYVMRLRPLSDDPSIEFLITVYALHVDVVRDQHVPQRSQGFHDSRVELGVAENVHDEVGGGVEEPDDVSIRCSSEQVLDVQVPSRAGFSADVCPEVVVSAMASVFAHGAAEASWSLEAREVTMCEPAVNQVAVGRGDEERFANRVDHVLAGKTQRDDGLARCVPRGNDDHELARVHLVRLTTEVLSVL